MDPRLRKLRVALWIMGLGTLIAVAWCAWQGWGLGRNYYPYNTYLSKPFYRFTDFTDNVQVSRMKNPFATKTVGLYFPATYIIFKLFSFLSKKVVVVLFSILFWIGVIVVQMRAFRELIPIPIRRAGVTAAFIGFSYPMLFCFDRGNIEIFMAVLIGAALILCRQRRFAFAATLIGMTMWLKLYSALLLVLLIRRRQLHHIPIQIVGFSVISFLALLTFSSPVLANVARWHTNFQLYNLCYIFCDLGLSGSSAPWNLCKVALMAADQAGWVHLHLNLNKDAPSFAWTMAILSAFYKPLISVLLILGVMFATFIERDFFRRAILLLMLTPFCSQSGADYRLLYFQIALIVLILLPTVRRGDIVVVVLLALILVPKKEVFLTFVTRVDSAYNDIDVGVIINPLLAFAAIALVVNDGWRESIPGWAGLRFQGLIRRLTRLSPGRFGGSATRAT